jgi:type II secretion system protein H
MRASRPADRTRRAGRGFTLVELILVMVLLTIVASFVAPRMSSFFRGRALSAEAQRLLSLTHYAQSRAVAEGVPVLLWIDPKRSAYGIEVQGVHATGRDHEVAYEADGGVTLQLPAVTDAPVSEDDDERLGLPENVAAIRFTPDGFFDEVSVRQIILRQGEGAALQIAPKANRLGYEIRPYNEAR